jgi:transposase
MNAEMRNQLLFIQIAQLKDENSVLQSQQEQLQKQLDKTENERDNEIAEIESEFKDKLENLKKEHQLKIVKLEQQSGQRLEEEKLKSNSIISETKRSFERIISEIQAEADKHKAEDKITIETVEKTMKTLLTEKEKLTELSKKSISESIWYRNRYWCRTSEQATLLQGRDPLNRKIEKALFQKDANFELTDRNASELDVDHRKKNKGEKRADYSKNKAYTDNPVIVRLEDYCHLQKGEHLKKRNGIVETRLIRKVEIIPMQIKETFIEVGTIRGNGQEDRDTIKIDDLVVPGVSFTADMISFILTEHFCFNTTWANICKKLKYYGMKISTSTLGNIVHRSIAYLNKSMRKTWISEIKKTDYWMIDETPILVGKEDKKGKRSYKNRYLWGIRANKLKLSWFIYDEGSRGTKVIKPYLDDFQGYYTTDGYIVYKLFKDILNPKQIRCACLTHIRRYFIEALFENRKMMSWFINKIKKLFSIESDCTKFKARDRADKRVARALPIVKKIREKFELYKGTGFDKLGTLTKSALNYISKEWDAMENYIYNGDVQISNNLCEQMMRHIKVNLKNSQNIGSEDCAENFGFMYSLIESCGFNELSPMVYVSRLLKRLMTVENEDDKRHLLPCYCKS